MMMTNKLDKLYSMHWLALALSFEVTRPTRRTSGHVMSEGGWWSVIGSCGCGGRGGYGGPLIIISGTLITVVRVVCVVRII